MTPRPWLTRKVLDKVGVRMKGVLKPLDYAVLPSDGKSIRWRNSAQWARNTMVNEDGRMKRPRTASGRQERTQYGGIVDLPTMVPETVRWC